MKESDVRKAGEKNRGRPPSDVPSAIGRDDVRNTPESAKRKADDEWLAAFTAEDPAFFIKPSDTV